MKMIFKWLVVVLLALMLISCTTVPQPKPIITQQNLLTYCTTDTPIPTNYVLDDDGNRVYTGEELYRVLIKWQGVYNDCASRHNQLVKAINDIQGINVKNIKK